jgi:hypothetical protein
MPIHSGSLHLQLGAETPKGQLVQTCLVDKLKPAADKDVAIHFHVSIISS